MCSYVEKCAEFKNKTLKKSAGTDLPKALKRDSIYNIDVLF